MFYMHLSKSVSSKQILIIFKDFPDSVVVEIEKVIATLEARDKATVLANSKSQQTND